MIPPMPAGPDQTNHAPSPPQPTASYVPFCRPGPKHAMSQVGQNAKNEGNAWMLGMRAASPEFM